MNEHTAVLRLRADTVAAAPLAVWRDQVPYDPEHPLSRRLVDREATRPLAPGTAQPRITVLSYRDGSADLVVVADRAMLDAPGLFGLLGSLSGEQLPRAGFGVPPPGAAAPAGSPDAGTGELVLDDTRLARWTRPQLVAAVTAVLARYQGAAEAGVCIAPAVPGLRYRPCLTPLFPLTLVLTVDGDRPVSAVCLFDESAVHPGIAEQFVQHVSTVADQLAAGCDPDRVTLLRPEDRARIVAAGRSPAPDGPLRAIPEIFRSVVARHGDRPAVGDGQRVLTYRQLDELAQRYCDGLRELGVGAGDFVGLCVERTVELVAVMLAVLRAGAAYVPLNEHDPAERLRYIVDDAGLSLVVATAFPALNGVRAVRPDTLAAAAPAPASATAPEAAPGDAAYVIYTSGSTGHPKGVVVPHRNVAALLAATTADLGLGAADVWTLFHAASFDFSVWEIWGCLLTGGRLVVVPYLVSRSPAEFHDMLVTERVTVLNQTPSAFANLNQADARQSAELALRLVIFGGEPLDSAGLQGWFDRHPPQRCRLVNMYGITETTVHVTARTITPADVRSGSRSVGRALPGWSVSVRDPDGAVLPFGVAGEIYVGGAGVAGGYLNRAELTAARFLRTDPDRAMPGHDGPNRLYRSGDRGRLHPDGTLDHLGRLDNQVKIRGFRIELDEIRSVLLADESVETAAVIVAGDDGDAAGQRIDAFVVATGPADPLAIRRRAARMLPDYMVPATVTALAALPLTSNGKLDVTALPAPGPAAPAPAPGAGGADSEVVLRVWQEILGLPTGPAADFFEHGGNSLLAVRLVAALQDAGLPPVSVRDVYRHRTVGRLSALIADRAGAAQA